MVDFVRQAVSLAHIWLETQHSSNQIMWKTLISIFFFPHQTRACLLNHSREGEKKKKNQLICSGSTLEFQDYSKLFHSYLFIYFEHRSNLIRVTVWICAEVRGPRSLCPVWHWISGCVAQTALRNEEFAVEPRRPNKKKDVFALFFF